MEMKIAKQKLTTMLADLEELSAKASESRKPIALDQQSTGRLSRMDSLQVQAMDQAQDLQRRKTMLRIKTALTRIENDEFGYCVTCGEPIAEKRLAFDPATPLCINCARG